VVKVLVQEFGTLGSRGSRIEIVGWGRKNSKWTKRTRQHPFCVLDRVWYSQKYLERYDIWWWRRMEISSTDSLKNGLLLIVKKQSNILQTAEWMKANWVGCILCRNCFLKHVVEAKVEGTGRRGRRLKQLMDGNENILEALDHNLCWTRFGRCNLMLMQ
jgi:hypothetical protein